jgi:hypothetical protein
MAIRGLAAIAIVQPAGQQKNMNMKLYLINRITFLAITIGLGFACNPGSMSTDGGPVCTAYGRVCDGYRGHGCALDSCNWCDCGLGWGGSATSGGCTQAYCGTPDAGGQPDGAAAWPACRDQRDCPAGYACLFTKGCDKMYGVCNGQTFYCPHNSSTFTVCGCDGKTATFSALGCEPDRPYAHAGPCP